MRLPLPLLVLATLPIASSAQRVVTRDSAGVRIVTSPPRSKLPVAFRMGPQLWDVGGLNDDPARELGKDGGRHAVVLSNGTIVVSDGTRVVYFDARGGYLGSFGRNGGGPGEFSSIASICARRGDTLQVTDGGQPRSTVISPARELMRVVKGRSAVQLSGCPDAAWTLTAELVQKGDGFTQWVNLRGIDEAGTPRVNFGDFSQRGMGATLRTGSMAAQGNRIALGNAIDMSVVIHDTTGRVVQRIQLDEQPVPITPADFKTGAAGWTAVNPKTGASGPMPTLPGSPTTWPSYGRLHYDVAGRLWVEEVAQQVATGWWTVFAPTGEALGRMQLPTSAKGAVPTVLGFTRDAILIRRQDNDGAPHVTAYRLVPAR
jgi:hypothetical protein